MPAVGNLDRALFAVLALDPARDMGAPGEWTGQSTQDQIPMDPASGGDSIGTFGQFGRRVQRNGARGQQHQGERSQDTGRHLGHDRSKDLGGWVLAFPVRILGVQGGRIFGHERRRGTDLRGRHKSLRHGDQERNNNVRQLGHD